MRARARSRRRSPSGAARAAGSPGTDGSPSTRRSPGRSCGSLRATPPPARVVPASGAVPVRAESPWRPTRTHAELQALRAALQNANARDSSWFSIAMIGKRDAISSCKLALVFHDHCAPSNEVSVLERIRDASDRTRARGCVTSESKPCAADIAHQFEKLRPRLDLCRTRPHWPARNPRRSGRHG